MMMMMMWHPISSQVACKVVFGEMPSGGVCKVSGEPLKVPSEGPTECKSSRTTCKHAYCVSAWGNAWLWHLPPSKSISPLSSPVQWRHSRLCQTQCDLPILHMPSPSASCLSSKTILKVCSWTVGDSKKCVPHCSETLSVCSIWFWTF